MMFSINFESNLVLLHSRTTSVGNFVNIKHFKNTVISVRTAECVIHLRLKLCTFKCSPNDVETIHSTEACNYEENYFVY